MKHTAEQKRLRSQARRLYPKATAIRHIHPHAYCIAKPAPYCAVFAIPPRDREPQVVEDREVLIQNMTVADVKLGDWCGLAYIVNSSDQGKVVIARYLP